MGLVVLEVLVCLAGMVILALVMFSDGPRIDK